MEYTNTKVNELFNLLEKACEMACDLRVMNIKNRLAIMCGTDETIVDDLTISMQERKEEAEEYITIFAKLYTALAKAEREIVRVQYKYNR